MQWSNNRTLLSLWIMVLEHSLAIQKITGLNRSQSASRWQPWANCSHACAFVIKQYNLVPAGGWWHSSAGKVTAGLAESNGSLPPRGWLKATCGLTACAPGSALGPTLCDEYGRITLAWTYAEARIRTKVADATEYPTHASPAWLITLARHRTVLGL